MMKAQIVRVADVAPTPWKNGGGTTCELLAWPATDDWIVRVSVADINASGPFSPYAGVDRWFAVLSGGDVSLSSAGSPPQRLGVSHTELHAFSGDAATECTALGAATRDFNIMLRRARGRLEAHAVGHRAVLATSCELVALFCADAAVVQADGDAGCTVPAMALACWRNPRRRPLRLLAQPAVRGWWLAADRRD